MASEPHASLLDWYRRLIALRREVLGTGETRFADVTCSVEDDGDTFVMTHRGIEVRGSALLGHADVGVVRDIAVRYLGDDEGQVPLEVATEG